MLCARDSWPVLMQLQIPREDVEAFPRDTELKLQSAVRRNNTWDVIKLQIPQPGRGILACHASPPGLLFVSSYDRVYELDMLSASRRRELKGYYKDDLLATPVFFGEVKGRTFSASTDECTVFPSGVYVYVYRDGEWYYNSPPPTEEGMCIWNGCKSTVCRVGEAIVAVERHFCDVKSRLVVYSPDVEGNVLPVVHKLAGVCLEDNGMDVVSGGMGEHLYFVQGKNRVWKLKAPTGVAASEDLESPSLCWEFPKELEVVELVGTKDGFYALTTPKREEEESSGEEKTSPESGDDTPVSENSKPADDIKPGADKPEGEDDTLPKNPEVRLWEATERVEGYSVSEIPMPEFTVDDGAFVSYKLAFI